MKRFLFSWIMAFSIGLSEAKADCATHIYDCDTGFPKSPDQQQVDAEQRDADEIQQKADASFDRMVKHEISGKGTGDDQYYRGNDAEDYRYDNAK